MKEKVLVGIVMGSESDQSVMEPASKILKEFKVNFEVSVLSAHRNPEGAQKYARLAVSRGIKVIIAGAGGAAHLAGAMAANYPLPVVGVPIKTSTLNGLDSLYSTVQMPRGVPVATVAIDGAVNAAILAVQILATSDRKLLEKLISYKKRIRHGSP